MELNFEQIKRLEDLITHEGWPLYQKLLAEKLEISLEDMRNSKDWSDFVESKGMANLLEFDIIPIIPDTLAEWKEELANRSNSEEIEKEED